MEWLRSLFGGGSSREPMTAREALTTAAEAVESRFPTYDAFPCLVYASPMEANFNITRDGRSRGWAVVFWSTGREAFVLARVKDGAAKCWEKAAGNRAAIVEYVYAVLRGGRGREPARLPPDWTDTPALLEGAVAALPGLCGDAEKAEAYGPLLVLFPAASCRYFQRSSQVNLFAPPPDGRAALMTIYVHEDPGDHDAYLFYVDAAGGAILHQETFRFPPLFNHGHSMDW